MFSVTESGEHYELRCSDDTDAWGEFAKQERAMYIARAANDFALRHPPSPRRPAEPAEAVTAPDATTEDYKRFPVVDR